MPNQLVALENVSRLGQILIQSFIPLNSHNRVIFSNNAYMVNAQIVSVLGETVQKEANLFGETEWRLAWDEFNEYFGD